MERKKRIKKRIKKKKEDKKEENPENKYAEDKKKEREELFKLASNLTAKKNDEIKDEYKNILNKMTIKKKKLFELIQDDLKPTENQFDELKILYAGFVGKISNIYSDLPYDKNDKLSLSIQLMALDKIVKQMVKYMQKYKNDLAKSKTRKIKKIDNKDEKEKDEKEKDKKTKGNSDLPLYDGPLYREQREDEEDKDYYKDIVEYLLKIRKLYLNKANKTNEESKIYNEIEDDKYDLGEKIKRWFKVQNIEDLLKK